MIKIALIGNPNAGKTTLYNELTGSNQYVGNWPGVTVEKKTGRLKSENIDAEIVDLPGIYSLSTISLEEEVAADYVINKEMDLIINIVDASNLERNLFLTFQLLDSGIPMIVALNQIDVIEKNDECINCRGLKRMLGIPVVPISASKKLGIEHLIHVVEKMGFRYYEHIKTDHPKLERKHLNKRAKRHMNRYHGNKIQDYKKHHYHDDFEKDIHTDYFKREVLKYNEVIEESISSFNEILNDRFTSIRFFEDGEKVLDKVDLKPEEKADILALYKKEKEKFDLDFDMVLPDARYQKIHEILGQNYTKKDLTEDTKTDKIDKILTSKVWGLPIFAVVMFTVFFLAFGPVGTWVTDQFAFLINSFIDWVVSGIASFGVAPYLLSLIQNGVFGGLAAVVGFLPQLAILFLFLAILEDSGYMARAAFIMDRALRRFGLSGKSFIPMLIGFGCSVPAIANTRTLDNEQDRKITAMIIPFVSCGAKAPIYGVFAGALFSNGSFIVVFSMYVLGLLVAILSAILFKKTLFKSAKANYIMELPEYRTPTFKNTMKHTWERCKDFLVKAGTVLLAAFIIIWFFSYFGFVNGQFRLLSEAEIGYSLLGNIGRFVLPIFEPIGFSDWQQTVSMLTGVIAKESVVGTLGILYGVNGDVLQNSTLLFSSIQAHFTPASAYAFMTFALLSTPCIAAVSALKRELGSWKYFTFIIVYQMVVAYLISFGIYHLVSLGTGTALTVIITAIIVVFVIKMTMRFIRDKSACGSCSNCAKSGKCGLPQYIKFKEDNGGGKEDE